MAIRDKALLILAGVVMVLLSGWGIRYHFKKVAELDTQIESLDRTLRATQAPLQARSKALQAAQDRYAAQSKELSDALKDSPAWASDRVPDAVFDSLFGPPATTAR